MKPLNLPSDFDATIGRQKSLFASLAGGLGGSLVIMGTGNLGRGLAERLPGLPIKIECFCDNNPAKHGTLCAGHRVVSVEEAVRRFNGKAVFVVGIYNSSAGQNQLRRLGCKVVITAATLCRHFGPPLTPFYSIDYPTAIRSELNDAVQCASLWSDDKSRMEYQNVLSWFCAPDQQTLVEHDPADETYFPPGLWTASENEHLVDCGAFDGDSVTTFIKKMGGKYGSITAYEPDPANYQALLRNTRDLPGRVHAVNAAIGAAADTIHLSSSGTVASTIQSEGTGLAVPCITLDDQHKNAPPTFIKMDIEGYELEALAGSRSVLSEHAPILAITTYHKVEHLWQIPLLIHRFQPKYRFYLRRYAEDCWETVCYAVPLHRCIR